jgi:hypothetical protein
MEGRYNFCLERDAAELLKQALQLPAEARPPSPTRFGQVWTMKLTRTPKPPDAKKSGGGSKRSTAEP